MGAGLCPVNALLLWDKKLENEGAGEERPGLIPRDDSRLIATEVGEPTELAGFGVREPRSEAVQALSAAGVAVHVSATGTE